MSPRNSATSATSTDAASEAAGTATAESTSTGPRRNRRTGRSGATTAARPSAGISLDEQPAAATAATETIDDQDAAATTVPTVSRPGGRRRPRTSAPPQQPPVSLMKKPFEEVAGERRLPFAPRTNVSLKQRLDGAVDWLKDVETTDDELPEQMRGWDCRSQHDIVNYGIHLALTMLEDHANGGKPFQVKVRRS